MIPRRQALKLACLIPLLTLATPALADDADVQHSIQMWHKLRQQLFQDKPIADGSALFSVEAPVRAADAAIVPLSVHFKAPQTPDHYVKDLYLIIDNNPSPVAGVFHLTPMSGRADMDTRVRIDNYTYIRFVAEYNDGKIYMVDRFVKASGGCSAPADKDAAAALARMGKMKFTTLGTVAAGKPDMFQLMISHPNRSGLAKNQVTGLYDSPMYVHDLSVTYNGKPVVTAELSFAISENPFFRFYFTPEGAGKLKATVEDTGGHHFEDSANVTISG